MGLGELIQVAVALATAPVPAPPAAPADELAGLSAREKAAVVVVSGLPAPQGVGGVLVRRWNTDEPRPRGALVYVDQEGEGVGLDLASVYRNLELLERHGVVHRIRAAGSAALYVLAGGQGEYLSCERCGAAIEVAPEQLDGLRDQVRERFGFEVTFRDVPMVGRCPACAAGSSR